MKITFKYNVGDTVTLIKKPSGANMQYGKHYMLDSEFSPKEYKIERCKCVIKSNNEPEILYNLYAYCDDYIQFHNWIPEDNLSGNLNIHEEDVEFISHDKELLSIGDTVLADVFSGSYDDPYLMPSLTFGYVADILKFEYEILSSGKPIRTAIIDHDGNLRTEFVPYLVKNMDRNFAMEYVKHCKKNRFNPIEGQFANHHMRLLKGMNLWDDVVKIYNNWNKYRKSASSEKKVVKKTVKKNTKKNKIEEFIKSLSQKEIEELKKRLS